MASDSTNSQSSGIIGGHFSGFRDQEEISNLELLEKESMFSEWTDEKHSLYLRSIETSFVQQLFSSMVSSGLHSHKKHSSYMRSSEQNESHAPDQKIKFGRGEPPSQKAGKSRILVQNPWIQHFRSRDSPPFHGKASYVDEPVSFEGRAIYTRTLDNVSDDFHICQTIGDASISEEFCGQNFEEEERTSSLHATKRMKTVEAMTETHE